jgi:signal transduction histidine kinase
MKPIGAFPVATRSFPWLTARRVTGVVVLAVASAAGISWLHARSQRDFFAQMLEALPQSVALSADVLGDWVAMRDAQAASLAALQAAGGRGTATLALQEQSVLAMMRSGGFVRGVVSDSLMPVMRRVRRIDSLTVIDFIAPVEVDGRARGSVLLTAVANPAAFSHFNVAAPTDLTQRTALFDLADGRAVSMTVSAPGGGASPATTASMPGGVQPTSDYLEELRRDGQRASRGIGRGITGQQVVYSRTPVPGTTWLLVRERDVAELTALLQGSLWFTSAVLSALVLLVIGVLLLRWRAGHLRQQHEAMQLRATFVASVSHELRTPLTQIRLYAEMLRLGLLPAAADATRALSIIEKEADRLSMLVERSLTFVRGGTVSEPTVPEPVNLGDAVQRAMATMAPLAAERGVTLQLDVVADVSARIERDDLQQILLNLLDNAIKYGPDGQEVMLRVAGDVEMVHIAVIDEGPGIPAEERDVVWQPFARGRDAQLSDQIGSGIGLAVVHDLVRRAGGRADVSDGARGGTRHMMPGTCIDVRLPAA